MNPITKKAFGGFYAPNGEHFTGPMSQDRLVIYDSVRAPVCAYCYERLAPAPAWFDGEPTYVGYLPCKCRAKDLLDDYGPETHPEPPLDDPYGPPQDYTFD